MGGCIDFHKYQNGWKFITDLNKEQSPLFRQY